MPTKKKRVGFIPREDVMKIIDKLSFENNLSNSKVINLLVEEALSIRGIYNKEKGIETESYIDEKENKVSSSIDNIDEKIQFNLDKLDCNYNLSKRIFDNQNSNNSFDLRTYEKFLLFLKFKEMTNKYDQ